MTGPPGRGRLQDARADARLQREGFVQLPLLRTEDVERLLEVYADFHPGGGRGFQTDFAYLAPERKRDLAHRIEDIVRPRLDAALEPFRIFNTSFVIKWPGTGNRVPLHQDWSYVDEEAGASATIWMPLVATSAAQQNGTLAVLPRSHRLPATRRSASTRPWYLPYRPQLSGHLEPLDVPVGNAVVFDGRLLHASPENLTGEPRVAIAAMVSDAGAELRYHHLDGGAWNIFEVDEDFYYRHSPIDLRARPITDAALLATEPFTPAPPPLDDLERLCGISLEPVDDDGAPMRLAGLPLGGPEPPHSGRRWSRAAGDLLHRWIDRRGEGPIFDHRGRDEVLAASSELRARWPALDDLDGPWVTRSTTDAGTWRCHRLTPHGPGAPLHQLLERTMAPRSAWIVEVPAGAELRPGRTGHNGMTTILWAPVPAEVAGSTILQVDRHIVAMDDGIAVAFDPTCRHTVVNLGASPVELLAVHVDRPLGRLQRRAVGIARRIRLVDEAQPICDR